MSSFTDEERDEIIKGWFRAQHTTTQAQYCTSVAERLGKVVMPRTLRSWIRGGLNDSSGANLVKMLRRTFASIRQMEADLEVLIEAAMKEKLIPVEERERVPPAGHAGKEERKRKGLWDQFAEGIE